MRCSFFFYHTDLGHNLFFFALFKPIILQVFTIWQDKYCTHSISRTIEARAGFAQQIIALTTLQNVCERMPGLFSQKNLVLCDMQGHNYGLLMKTLEIFPKSLFGQPDGFSLLTGTKFAVRLIELPFTLQHDREIVMFMFYFPFFIKLCMVLLCVIFKSE